jgi:predicted transcriptional regulator
MAAPRPKEEVRRLLDTLPDEASYEDIQYHIYVQQKIDRGLEASERGDFISDEEITGQHSNNRVRLIESPE